MKKTFLREMDRLGIGPRASTRYLTYPERAERHYDDDDDDDDDDYHDDRVAPPPRDDDGERALVGVAAARKRTEDVIAATPLVTPSDAVGRVGRVSDSVCRTKTSAARAPPPPPLPSTAARGAVAVAIAAAPTGGLTSRRSRTGDEEGAMTTTSTRPPRRILYDASVGVEPRRGRTDAEKEAHMLDADGEMPKSAYRDLEALD